MAFKYSLEGFHPTADVRPWTSEDLKNDSALLDRFVELWWQLDEAEDKYDKPFGIRLPLKNRSEQEKFFRKRLLETSGYAVYEGDQCVGFCMVKPCEYEDSYWISTLVIDEEFRGKHYGSALLSYIASVRKGEHCLLRVSMNNKAGLALYKSQGFVPMTQVMIRK